MDVRSERAQRPLNFKSKSLNACYRMQEPLSEQPFLTLRLYLGINAVELLRTDIHAPRPRPYGFVLAVTTYLQYICGLNTKVWICRSTIRASLWGPPWFFRDEPGRTSLSYTPTSCCDLCVPSKGYFAPTRHIEVSSRSPRRRWPVKRLHRCFVPGAAGHSPWWIATASDRTS